MKFKYFIDTGEIVLCEACGGENFRLIAGPRFRDTREDGVLAFYKCARCGHAGLWPRLPDVDNAGPTPASVSDETLMKSSH